MEDESMKIKEMTAIPAGFVITRCKPAPRSATLSESPRMRVRGDQTRLPMPSRKQKAARK